MQHAIDMKTTMQIKDKATPKTIALQNGSFELFPRSTDLNSESKFLLLRCIGSENPLVPLT